MKLSAFRDGLDVPDGRVAVASVARVLLLSAMVAFAAGCGSSSDAGSTSKASSSGDSGAAAAQAKLWKGDGYVLPATNGPKPEKGKNVWVLSCLQALEGCSTPAAAAVEAAKSLGWKVTLFDTQYDPSRISQGIRQAIADGADGIVQYSLDCSTAKSSFSAARDAGVKVVGAEALDCPTDKVFDWVVTYAQGPFQDWWAAYGAGQAQNLIHKTNGNAQVISLHQTDLPNERFQDEGFQKQLATCAGCKIVETVDFTIDDLSGDKLQQKLQQALVQHPEANALQLPYNLLDSGVAAAVRASGRAAKLVVAFGQQYRSTGDQLRRGDINGIGIGIPEDWEAYSQIDALVRLFAGQQPVSSGIGLQSFDKDHNLPATGTWTAPLDFKAAYAKAWGTGSAG